MKNLSFIQRLRFALSGLRSALISEASFRTQIFAGILVFLFLLIMQPQPLWWAIMILTVALVLMAEMFNTSLEHLMDHVHPEKHEMIRIAKDCAAGAVLIGSFSSIAVFIAILWDIFLR